MDRQLAKFVLLITVGLVQGLAAQRTPPTANMAWHSKEERDVAKQLVADRQPSWQIDSQKTYTLSELIDLAELHNPETKAAWMRARERADQLGIARSAYYPTLEAAVFAASIRQPALIGEYFHRQTIAFVSPTLHVEYLIFDLGGRSGTVDVAKANLLVQNLEFNDTHRRLIYEIASTYFRLLNAKGQREAAEISLKNAETVESDAENRMKNGLATRPDLLEASAARAQADYDLQARIGDEQIAKGELATAMGLPAEAQFVVQSISEIPIPTSAADALNEEIERAFQQRPELLADIARIRAAHGELKQARSSYFPVLHFTGNGGLARGYGQQDLLAGHYAEGEIWSAGLELRWTLFDGARREHGKLVHRKAQVGDLKKYPTESAAQAAADAFRLTINNQCAHRSLRRTTINTLWEHYSQEELPLKALSTQDAYTIYANNWIIPRWGNLPLEDVKTVEVERWLRATDVADGTRAKIKCVMSALFSHAVRWEFCAQNPISSGIPVGSGGKRGPSTGVRISAKRRSSPLVLSPEQVKLGLDKLEFREQLLVFLDGALGIRQGELGALRWLDCDFENLSFSVEHS